MSIDAPWMAILLTVVSLLCTYAGYKAKETRESSKELSERIDGVEKDHRSLELRYIESNARVGAKVDQLASAVNSLTLEVRSILQKLNNVRGT